MYQNPCKGTEAHIMTYMKPMKSAYKPGTQWNYSTGETDMVGILVQKATGKSLAEYLSEKIWIPYGMEQCAYWLADECSNLNIGGSGLSATLFFFSSRRRHTILTCDWSSDVCSSDLSFNVQLHPCPDRAIHFGSSRTGMASFATVNVNNVWWDAPTDESQIASFLKFNGTGRSVARRGWNRR